MYGGGGGGALASRRMRSRSAEEPWKHTTCRENPPHTHKPQAHTNTLAVLPRATKNGPAAGEPWEHTAQPAGQGELTPTHNPARIARAPGRRAFAAAS